MADSHNQVAGPQLDMREKLCAKAASRANSSNATKRCQGRNLGTKNKKMHQWLVQVAECDGSGLHRGMCRAPHHDTVRVLQEPLPPKRVRFMDKASASDTAKACVNVATVSLGDRHTLGISAPSTKSEWLTNMQSPRSSFKVANGFMTETLLCGNTASSCT